MNLNLLHCSNSRSGTRSEARRAHLLSVSRQLFVDRGFHNTGVAQIATASGIKVGQIYRDFASKEDIVAAIVEADLVRFLDEASLRRTMADGDLDGVRAWLSSLFNPPADVDAQHSLMLEIYAESSRNPRIRSLFDAVEARIETSLMRAFGVLVPAADEAARRGLADLILTFAIGLHHRRIFKPSTVSATAARIGGIVNAELAALGSAHDGCGRDARLARPSPLRRD